MHFSTPGALRSHDIAIRALSLSSAAVRINRAATEMNLRTVSIYAYEDRNSAHRWDSDESYLLPASGTPVGAYLDITSIIDVAKENGVDAIHPGYGFLSESAEFGEREMRCALQYLSLGVAYTPIPLLSYSPSLQGQRHHLRGAVGREPRNLWRQDEGS